MVTRKDAWPKPRSHGRHLTAEEIHVVEEGFRQGRNAFEVAHDLKCAARSIHRRFLHLRLARDARLRQKARAWRRLYKSDFVPS